MKVTKVLIILLTHFFTDSNASSYGKPSTVKARVQQYETFAENQATKPLSFRTHYQGGRHPTKFIPEGLGKQSSQYFNMQPPPRQSTMTLSREIENQLGLVRKILEGGGALQGYDANTLSPTSLQGDFFVVTKEGQSDPLTSCRAGLGLGKHAQLGGSQVNYEMPKRNDERPSPTHFLKAHSSPWSERITGQQLWGEGEVKWGKAPISPAALNSTDAYSPNASPPPNDAFFSGEYTDEDDKLGYSEEEDSQAHVYGKHMEEENEGSDGQFHNASQGGDYGDDNISLPPAQQEIKAFPDLPSQPTPGGYSQAELEQLSAPYHPKAWERDHAQLDNFPVIKKNLGFRLRKGNPPPHMQVSPEEQERLDARAIETLRMMKKTVLKDFDGLLKELQGPLSSQVATFGKSTLVYFLNTPHHHAKAITLATKFQELGKRFAEGAINMTPGSAGPGTHFVFRELCHLLYIGPDLENWCIKERILK